MWYENSLKVDLTKPIIAADKENPQDVFVLLPHTAKEQYVTTGYDWFNLEGGCWNSCMYYESLMVAVRSYENTYKISNAEINVKAV